jgi:hypothetical protein
VGDRVVRATFDEIADPIAAVEETAAFAVNIPERGFAGDDALETG